ncbi:MAG: RagB/SusD family nutrient uptake outer membrane protein [Saprospiraceae bacterium]|nr:RagB/SusD family nutrient uptake outer membrane protein [Saprospiraceae bacterium]
MKTYKKILFSIFLLSTISCDDSFIEAKLNSAIDINQFLKSPVEFQQLLNSSYDALSYGNVYGGQIQLMSELMSDGVDGDYLTNNDWRALFTWTSDIFLAPTRTLMYDGYKAIARANLVLENLNIVPGLDDANKKRMEGEALFIRALMHFELVRYYGQPYGYTADNSHPGIPLRTSFGQAIADRATVAAVYNQCIADAEKSESLLPLTNGVYANQFSVKAFLAKLYFQQNNFIKAKEYAEQVINSSGAILDNLPNNKFGYGDSKEILFGLVSTDYSNDNANISIQKDYFSLTKTIPDIIPANAISLAVSGSGDIRAFWFEKKGNYLICTKFNTSNTAIYTNPVIHLSELYLILAESLAETGTDGLTYLNAIRKRAGLTELKGSSTSQQIEECRVQRRAEFYFENNRLHELKRIAVRGSKDLLIRNLARWDCPGLVCQFPDNELKGNPDLKPNPTAKCY